MIGVIADDITGAAEIAALGWRHGLHAEVILEGKPSGKADLVCIDTDSRSCAPADAAQRAADAAAMLQSLGARWIYKKTDSVLRGNVTPEIEAVVKQLKLTGSLLIPANPSRGRTIVGGRYLIDGKPIHETEFANDPEYPRHSSEVVGLLSPSKTLPISASKLGASLSSDGIVIGEVANSEDVAQWAAQKNDSRLMAGGAEFFENLLDNPERQTSEPPQQLPKPRAGELFVCGSASEAARNFVAEQARQGVPVLSLPEKLATESSFTPEEIASLANEATAALQTSNRIILHIGLPRISDPSLTKTLPHHLAKVASEILRRTQVRQIFAEGGATAVALAHRMGWGALSIAHEIAPGVVTLTTAGDPPLHLTIKPGSYAWPDSTIAPG